MNKVIVINIKGRDWSFKMLSDKTYDKKFNSNPDEESSCASTVNHEKAVYLKKSELTLPTIRHECMHCLVFSSLVESSSLDSGQMEELCCEIVGEHGPELMLWTEKIMNFFTGVN